MSKLKCHSSYRGKVRAKSRSLGLLAMFCSSLPTDESFKAHRRVLLQLVNHQPNSKHVTKLYPLLAETMKKLEHLATHGLQVYHGYLGDFVHVKIGLVTAVMDAVAASAIMGRVGHSAYQPCGRLV